MQIQEIPQLMESTAASLRHSLDLYWPSDVEGRNDLNERNLSLHFAHVLLSKGFGVFAEAHYPVSFPDGKFLDLLGISPDGDCCVVCEFKKHGKERGMTASTWDVERILKFDLHREIAEPRWSKRHVEISSKCRTGIGIVAGLKWTNNSKKSPRLGDSQKSDFAVKIAGIGGAIGESILVWDQTSFGRLGGYYLQFASFPLSYSPSQE